MEGCWLAAASLNAGLNAEYRTIHIEAARGVTNLRGFSTSGISIIRNRVKQTAGVVLWMNQWCNIAPGGALSRYQDTGFQWAVM
jgi:hypothetical protein